MNSMNVWYAKDLYHVRWNGKYQVFTSYLECKNYIDKIMQSVYFYIEEAA